MATVQQIVEGAEALLDVPFRSAEPAAVTLSDAYIWIQEAYGLITDVIRKPVESATQSSVADQKDYPIPAGAWDGVDSFEVVTWNSKPLQREHLLDVAKRNDDNTWLTLGGKTTPSCYLEGDDDDEFWILPAPSSIQSIVVYYVAAPALPTSISDSVPKCYVPYIQAISKYVAGRALEKFKDPRGTSYIGEFEGRLMNRVRNFREKNVLETDAKNNPAYYVMKPMEAPSGNS